MTEFVTEKIIITSEKRSLFGVMQVSKDFLLIVPTRQTDFHSNLSKLDSPPPEQVRLFFDDVVVKDDHAAFPALIFTSRTIPRRTQVSASFTASGVMIP
jgi:hypothetical protein